MLPHVADYMTFDSDEKLNKFKNIILSEIIYTVLVTVILKMS